MILAAKLILIRASCPSKPATSKSRPILNQATIQSSIRMHRQKISSLTQAPTMDPELASSAGHRGFWNRSREPRSADYCFRNASVYISAGVLVDAAESAKRKAARVTSFSPCAARSITTPSLSCLDELALLPSAGRRAMRAGLSLACARVRVCFGSENYPPPLVICAESLSISDRAAARWR